MTHPALMQLILKLVTRIKMDENESYIFGLLITDGNLYLTTRNRGRVVLEVSIKDKDIVHKLYETIPHSSIHQRKRNTNFKNDYATISFWNHQWGFRQKLIDAGFPTQNKTMMASPPLINYNKYHFWRGVIDGDGSLGVTSQNIPFVSLTTKSEALKDAYITFIQEEIGVNINAHRNQRDNIYNIMLTRSNALKLTNLLYRVHNGLSIQRKQDKAEYLFQTFGLEWHQCK